MSNCAQSILDSKFTEVNPFNIIPLKKEIVLFQGNEINLVGIGRNDNDDDPEISLDEPFNFQSVDDLEVVITYAGVEELAHIKMSETEGNIILGQSEQAIDYDIAKGNPDGFTKDEFHFIDSDWSFIGDSGFRRVDILFKMIMQNSVYGFLLFKSQIKNNRSLCVH